MKIASVRTVIIDGNFPWVLIRIETDDGLTLHVDVAHAHLICKQKGPRPWDPFHSDTVTRT